MAACQLHCHALAPLRTSYQITKRIGLKVQSFGGLSPQASRCEALQCVRCKLVWSPRESRGRTRKVIVAVTLYRDHTVRLRPAPCSASALLADEEQNISQPEALASSCIPSQTSEEDLHGNSCENGRLAAGLLAGLLWPVVGCATALADELVAYKSDAGGDVFKTLAGVAYIVLVVVFVVRLLKRRAKNATSERIARIADEEELANLPPEPKATPVRAAWGAIQAGVCAFFLFKLSNGIDSFFDGQQLPTQYTARNITVSVRTITSGMSYLLTFIFAANALGLTGLTFQLLISPDVDKAPEPPEDIRDSTSG